MHTREKVLIINALHRHSFYNRSLNNAAISANKLNDGPEYIVVEANFETNTGGQSIIEQVAALTAQAAATHQPIKIYQCVDYNEGNSGSVDSSLPALMTCNNAANIAAPIAYVLDGSDSLSRQRDEKLYGQGDYRFIMKFIVGLKTGLRPAPSPSPDASSSEMHPRSTSAPPAAQQLPVRKVKKTHANSIVGNHHQSVIDETKRTRSLTEIIPHALHNTSSSSVPIEKTEHLVDVKFHYDPLSELNPLVLSINAINPAAQPMSSPLAQPMSAPTSLTHTATDISGSPSPLTPISLPSPLPLYNGRHEHISISVSPATLGSSDTTTTLMELFGTRHSQTTLLSPAPVRKALSPIISRTATPDPEHAESHSPVFGASSGSSHFHTSIFLPAAASNNDSPTHSPLLAARTLNHGRNSPFRTSTPSNSPSNSPSTLYARLHLRRPSITISNAALEALTQTLADRLVDTTEKKSDDRASPKKVNGLNSG